jgi:hypothetical protein
LERLQEKYFDENPIGVPEKDLYERKNSSIKESILKWIKINTSQVYFRVPKHWTPTSL